MPPYCGALNPCGAPIDHDRQEQGQYCPECDWPCRYCKCKRCERLDHEHYNRPGAVPPCIRIPPPK